MQSSSSSSSSSDSERADEEESSFCVNRERGSAIPGKAPNGIGSHGCLPRPKKRLPTIILMVMKIACVFHYSNVTCDRTCYRCRMHGCKDKVLRKGPPSSQYLTTDEMRIDPAGQWYQDPDRVPSRYEELCEERDRGGPETACALCESVWWNYDGVVEKYNDKDIGLTSWNHPGSWLLSLFVIFGGIVFVVWDLTSYVSGIWGDPTQIIHLLNYGEFMFLLILYPVCNLISKVTSVATANAPSQPGLSWATAINARYIVKRLQFVGFEDKGIPGKPLLVFVLLVPAMLAALRGYLYIAHGYQFNFRNVISVGCVGAVFCVTATYQYLVYLMRLSFQRQFHLIAGYLKTHQHRRLDDCREILGNALQDFNCFRKYVSLFMIVYTPIITWSITTQVVWQYLVHDALCAGQNNARAEGMILETALVAWCNIISSLAATLWPIGGPDIGYVLHDFRRTLVSTKEVLGLPKNWQRLIEFFDDVTQDPRYGVNATTLFSVISFFMALQLDQEQSVSYYEEITCNESALRPAVNKTVFGSV